MLCALYILSRNEDLTLVHPFVQIFSFCASASLHKLLVVLLTFTMGCGMSSPKSAPVGAVDCNSADELLVATNPPPAPIEAVDFDSVDELLVPTSPPPAPIEAVDFDSVDELLVPTSPPPAPVEAVDYDSVDELLAPTMHGALAPLSGRFLLGLAEVWRV